MKLLAPPKTRRSTRRRTGKAKPKTTTSGPQRDPATGRLFGGNPGNRGGVGRPPNEFKEFLATEILGSPQFRKNLKDIAECDIAGAAAQDAVLAVRAAGLILQLGAWAADRVEGKATQPLRFDPSEEATVKALREMTNEELIAHLKTVDSEDAHGR